MAKTNIITYLEKYILYRYLLKKLRFWRIGHELYLYTDIMYAFLSQKYNIISTLN